MSDLRVIGIDPGPTPGLVLLDYTYVSDLGAMNGAMILSRVEALQCTAGLLGDLLEALFSDGAVQPKTIVQVERYVTGNRSSRSLVPKAGAVTRELVTVVQRVCGFSDVPCYARSASEVKPWADANEGERLARVGLLEPTKGMRHARDAARHALFCAVHDGGVPDPLSNRSGKRHPQ